MRRLVSGIVLFGVLSAFACNSNKPAEEVIDAKDRVKSKVEGIREDQQKAAEETGVADQQPEE